MRALKFDAETHCDLWDRLTRGTPNTIVCLVECYFHAVEAPVEVQVLQTLGEFELFLLRGVQLLRHPSLRELDGLLHLGHQALRQATTALVENGLLAEDTSNSLELTARGTAAITSGVATRHERRRLVFHFIHPSNEYVRIHDLRRPTLFDLGRQDTPRGWHWDTTSLLQPMGLPEEWKREREFPLDVVRLITKGDLGTDDTPPDTLDGTNEDIDGKYLRNWLVCTPIDVGPDSEKNQPVQVQGLVITAETRLLVPRYLHGHQLESEGREYRCLDYSSTIRILPSSPPTVPADSVEHRGSATTVLPDHVYGGHFESAEDRFPADTQFVLSSDGFYGAFATASELWVWLQANKDALQTGREQSSLFNELHERLRERSGDDDMSLVWMYPDPPAYEETSSQHEQEE